MCVKGPMLMGTTALLDTARRQSIVAKWCINMSAEIVGCYDFTHTVWYGLSLQGTRKCSCLYRFIYSGLSLPCTSNLKPCFEVQSAAPLCSGYEGTPCWLGDVCDDQTLSYTQPPNPEPIHSLQIDQQRRQAQEMRKRRRLFDEDDNDDGDNGDSRGYSTGSSSDGEASVAELSENSRVAGQMLYNLPKYSSVPERRKGVTPAQPSLMYDDDDDEW